MQWVQSTRSVSLEPVSLRIFLSMSLLMMCSSQLTRLSEFEGEVLMCWVEGVLVVVSVPASHDWVDNKLYLCHCFSPLQEESQRHLVSQSS